MAMPSIPGDSRDEISEFETRPTFIIKNPLVVMLGIGKYDCREDLIGVKMDYKNIIALFNHYFNYSIYYQTSDNINKYYNSKPNNNTKQNLLDNYKLHWTYDEIIEFMNDVHTFLNKNLEENSTQNNGIRHDALIWVISSHGDSGNVLIESEGEEFQLLRLFNKFDGKSIPLFQNNPKLFFVDACRGVMKPQPVPIAMKQSNYKISSDTEEESVEKQTKGGKKCSTNKVHPIALKSVESMHKEANFRYIYGNPDGYAVFDGGKKGGYLIQAMKNVFGKKEALVANLDEIIPQIRSKVSQFVGSSIQHVQDINNSNLKIYFQIRQKNY